MTVDASVDFTGGIPQVMDLTDTNLTEDTLYKLLKKLTSYGAFVGVSVAVKNYLKTGFTLARVDFE